MASLAAGLACSPAPRVVGAAAMVAFGALGLATRRPGPALLAAGLVLSGLALGQARLASIDRPGARLREGEQIRGEVVALERARPGRFGSSLQLELQGGRARGARLLGSLPQWLAASPPEPGSVLSVRGSFRRLRGHAGYPAYMRSRGVAGELEVERARTSGRRRDGPRGALDWVRRRAESGVAAGLGSGDAALLRGMVLGQDEAVGRAVRLDWRRAGLAHLLAVSGQNVMLLVALALPALAAAGLGRGARAWALLALIGLYVPVAGAGPSLQRAGVMGAAAVVATAAARPASRSYALLLAAAVTLAVNPRAAADPGWQLSFAALVGILVAGARLRRLLLPAVKNVPAGRALADGTALTVAATLATAPLLAYHFGAVSIAALPANLLALPAVAPAMWLGMVKAALGIAGTRELAHVLGLAARPFVVYLELLAERFAALPGASVGVRAGSGIVLAAAYCALGLLGGAVVLMRRRAQDRAIELAARWRRAPARRRRAVLAAAGLMVALTLVRLLGPAAPPRALTVRFLDVGQGDATLIQHPDGTAVLFDGGPPEGGVARLLRRAGVRRLAAVVATHHSRDHHGGLREVLEQFPVGVLLDGGDGTRDPTFRAVEGAADRRGVRRVPASAPMELRAGALRIRVLSPPPRPPGPPPDDPNARAVVAIVSSGSFDLFLSADAESDALGSLDLPRVEAMKIPHHGSADQGLPGLLRRLRPELAAIEVGAHNLYGHPAASTLAALRRARVVAYRTDRNGTVTLTVDHGLRVSVDRHP
ncbi:MAG TPA: ComEC/Rec2 family competence protein [Thermoleophilaceae bacterium]|nr:ComEC/Rec2 family competence protein [Thermoleophilaceae bacterium]